MTNLCNVSDGRWKSAINFTNMMGTKGRLTGAFATLVHEMWGGDLPYLTPNDFRVCDTLFLPHCLKF